LNLELRNGWNEPTHTESERPVRVSNVEDGKSEKLNFECGTQELMNGIRTAERPAWPFSSFPEFQI
jgi:hypothetical protein